MATRRNGSTVTRLLRDLEGDPAARQALAEALGMVMVGRNEFLDLVREVRGLAQRIEEQGRRIEELGRRIEEQGRRIEEQGRRIEAAFRHVDALGARWGFKSEAAFRNGLREVLASRFGATVERWEHQDAAGEIHGVGAAVELDVVVKDGEPLLIEVKSHAGVADVGAFRRKADLYDRLHGTRSRRLLISPAIDERAAELAAHAGIGVSTDLA